MESRDINPENIQAILLTQIPEKEKILLSGFVFPQESMPYIIYLIGQIIPVTYFIRILRGIILRGAGFYDLWHSAAVLGVMGIVVLTISALRFHKTVS